MDDRDAGPVCSGLFGWNSYDVPAAPLSNLPSSQAREDLADHFLRERSGYSTSMLNLFLSRSRVTVNFSGVDSRF